MTQGIVVRSIAAAALALAAGGSRAGDPAEPILVLTLDASRSYLCGEIDFNVADGGFFDALRAALLDPANFGDGGVIERRIVFLPSVAAITGVALLETDVLMLSLNQEQLSGCERFFVQTFIAQGGGVISFSNLAAIEVGPVFGGTGTLACRGGTGTIVAPSSPLVSGLFGTVSGEIPLMWHCVFTSLGAGGTEVVSSSLGGPWCASYELGTGRAVLACDEEWVGSTKEKGCAAPDLDDPKLVLFLNSVAWITPPVGFAPTLVPAVVGDINEDCLVNGEDLGLLLAALGTDDRLADFNHDGVVDGADLGILLANWT